MKYLKGNTIISKTMNVAVGLAASAAVSVMALQSTAMAGSSLCGSKKVCIYDGNNFIGLLAARAAGGGISNVYSGIEDKMDSWENKSSTNARWYYNANGGGRCVTMRKATEDNNINWHDSDELSSWATNGACS